MGRKKIKVDYKEITEANVVEVLQKVFPMHLENRRAISFLMDYEKGKPPISKSAYNQAKKISTTSCPKLSPLCVKPHVAFSVYVILTSKLWVAQPFIWETLPK